MDEGFHGEIEWRRKGTGTESTSSFASKLHVNTGQVAFCLPTQELRMMARVSVKRAWEFQVGGVVLLLLAGSLGYGVYVG